MQLLGVGLELELIGSLFSIPLDGTNDFLIFDGWPFGQYLFGVDGILTNGQVQGGFVSPYWDMNPDSLFWSIEAKSEDSQPFGLAVTTPHHQRFFLFNLHMHSKMLIGPPRVESEFWSRAIHAANTKSPFPTYDLSVSLETHAKNGNTIGRAMRFLKRVVRLK